MGSNMNDGIAEEFEGRLIAGPFRSADLRSLEHLLADLGIHASVTGRRAVWSRSPEGYMMSIFGEDVRAYFVDEDGDEVPQSDMDDMIRGAVAEGVEFTIRGVHYPADDKALVSYMTALHDGGRVVWRGGSSLVPRSGRSIRLEENRDLLRDLIEGVDEP